VAWNKQIYPIPQGIPTTTDAFASVAPAAQGTLIDLGRTLYYFLGAHRGFWRTQGAHMELNQLSSKTIQAAIAVHKELGPGLLESVYQACMLIELENMGIEVESEVYLPIIYRGKTIEGQAFRLDLVVEEKVVLELKSVNKVEPVHKKQLLTYLRLANKPLGLLINFNESLLKEGITRIINT
jgi:GxxExxY protein